MDFTYMRGQLLLRLFKRNGGVQHVTAVPGWSLCKRYFIKNDKSMAGPRYFRLNSKRPIYMDMQGLYLCKLCAKRLDECSVII